MFVQVIDGRTSQDDAVREVLERWVRELAPGAPGWLGSTVGITSDGRLIATARFDSEENARRNSDRAEQDKWWFDMVALLDGEPRVVESNDVQVNASGNPDEAGFVQVIRTQSTDPARMRDLMRPPEDFRSLRPDVIGDVTVVAGDELITFVYFTAEDEARRNEQKMPAERRAVMDEALKLAVGDPDWYDLTSPMLLSPR